MRASVTTMQKCWSISYYFRRGHSRTLLRGQFCGCQPGDTREDAIAQVSPIEPQDAGCVVVKVTARRSRKGHYCFVNEKET